MEVDYTLTLNGRMSDDQLQAIERFVQHTLGVPARLRPINVRMTLAEFNAVEKARARAAAQSEWAAGYPMFTREVV